MKAGKTAPGLKGRIREGGNRDGFTLLEVMICLVVLAVGAALTMSAISGSLGNIRNSQLRTRVMEDAQNVLEAALYREDLQQPATATEDLEGGFHCEIQVEEYQPPTETEDTLQSSSGVPITLLQYTVAVIGPDSPDPIYQLQTLKLVSSSTQGSQQSTTQ